MKKISFFALLMIGVLFACNNDSNDFDPEKTEDILTQGEWKVSYYFDSGKDETSDFAPFTFTFRDDGVFEADNQSTVFQGTWGLLQDDGANKLLIAINGVYPLSELNEDWVIIELKDDSIKLLDDSSSSADEEELHFRKI